MEAISVEATVQSNGRVVVDNLPFEEGSQVEVIVSEVEKKTDSADRYPLRGSVLKYDDPFGPAVPLDDWEALK